MSPKSDKPASKEASLVRSWRLSLLVEGGAACALGQEVLSASEGKQSAEDMPHAGATPGSEWEGFVFNKVLGAEDTLRGPAQGVIAPRQS